MNQRFDFEQNHEKKKEREKIVAQNGTIGKADGQLITKLEPRSFARGGAGRYFPLEKRTQAVVGAVKSSPAFTGSFQP